MKKFKYTKQYTFNIFINVFFFYSSYRDYAIQLFSLTTKYFQTFKCFTKMQFKENQISFQLIFFLASATISITIKYIKIIICFIARRD